MEVVAQGQVGVQQLSDGVTASMRQGRSGEQVVSELNGRYYEQAMRGNLYVAHAIVTAPVAFTTAAGTGGPFLWNGTQDKNAVVLAVGIGLTVVTTVAAALGLTGGVGQSAVPTATTAIDSRTNMKVGSAASGCTPYRIATPATAGSFFIPFAQLHTGALTADTLGAVWVDIGGALVVPPNSWCSVAASVTASTTVAHISMLWTELPV